MKTIFKYRINILDETPVETKGILKICHVEPDKFDGRIIWVWAAVDTELTQETDFCIRGTGHPLPTNGVFCGTVLAIDGFVWHLFIRNGQFRDATMWPGVL